MPNNLFYPSIAVTLTATLLIATYTDIKRREIPNWLVLFGMIVGFALWTIFNFPGGIKVSLLGWFSAFSIFLLLGLMGAMAFGDVKLMGTVGMFVGWPYSIQAVAHTVIAGFFLAIFWVALSGKLKKTFLNLWIVFSSWVKPGKPRTKLENLETSSLPYGIAITLGGIWTLIAIKYPFWDIFNLMK